MEALTIIGAIAAIAIVGGISFAVHSYSSGTYGYLPFNRVTIGISFVCGLLIAVGVYLWLGAGFTANTLVVLGCGILVYVGLLVFVTLRSNILIAIWTVTILSALSAVVILVLLGRRVFRREAASLDGPEDPCRTYGNGPRQLHRAVRERKKERKRKEKATPLHRAGAEDHAEDQEEEGHAEALALADPNAWNLDDANGLGAELEYLGVDPEDRDPEDR